jgi:hypothetical protein
MGPPPLLMVRRIISVFCAVKGVISLPPPALRKQGSDEKEQDFSFRCAWVSIYEKQDGQWAQVVDAPSFQFQTNDDESTRATG